MDDFIERAKQENPIEDVIGEAFTLTRTHVRYLRAAQHDSLVIDTQKQTFHWNSQGDDWQGDVITWLVKQNGWDFKHAVDWLCRRAVLPLPNWGAVDEGTLMRSRLLQDVFAVAAAEFHRWLIGDEERKIKADPEALGYCSALEYQRGDGVQGKGRCWTMETLQAAQLGFSGRKAAAQIKSMQGEFSLFGIDPESPQAVSILGFSGDVAGWAKSHQVEASPRWVEYEHVTGMMDKPRLIYVHNYGGRVRYLTGRNLPGYDTWTDKETGKETVRKSHNPPKELVGERQAYFNHVYRRDAAEVTVVEGQGDAVTLAQLGIPAIALCGVSMEDESMRSLVRLLDKQGKYLGLDDDKAGKNKTAKVAAMFGPMTRLIEWPAEPGEPILAEPQAEAEPAHG